MKIYFEGTPVKELRASLTSLNLEVDSFERADLYYPSGKGSNKNLIKAIERDSSKMFCQVPGLEYLAGKSQLWVKNYLRLGRERTLQFLPRTYILKSATDFNSFQSKCDAYPFSLFILKGNRQKRKSIRVISGKDLRGLDLSEYVIGQEAVTSNKSLSDQAFHIRAYLLVSMNQNEIQFFLYDEGKCIYAENGGLISSNEVNVPKGLPEKLSQFDKGLLDSIDGQLLECLKIIKDTIVPVIKEKTPVSVVAHQILGFDFMIDPNFKIKILEFNFRPELDHRISEIDAFKADIKKEYFELFDGKELSNNWIQVQ